MAPDTAASEGGAQFQSGDTALVFDGTTWRRTGDVEDNGQFWHPCVLRHVYHKQGERLASVEWPDGHVTTGHIVSMMRAVDA